jgi:hypothetical protein
MELITAVISFVIQAPGLVDWLTGLSSSFLVIPFNELAYNTVASIVLVTDTSAFIIILNIW